MYIYTKIILAIGAVTVLFFAYLGFRAWSLWHTLEPVFKLVRFISNIKKS